MAVLSKRPHMRCAAPFDREQGPADSLHPGGVPRPCQNGRNTAVTSGHPRTPRTIADLGVRRSDLSAKRTPKVTR